MAIDSKVLKQAQNIMLEMLIEFDAICSKHHLRYWLDSGTLLGAVRHQGFIPWDDDIDISMPVEEYEKFIKIASSELSSNIFFQHTPSDKNFPFDYLKLRSNKAQIIEFHEEGQEITYHQGVFVDIFPMLSIKDSSCNSFYYKNAFKLIRLFSAKNINIPFIRKLLVKSLEKMHQGWGKENNKVIYSGKMPDVGSMFEEKKVFPLEKMLFEGREFFVPNDATHYLENIYSFDFMELPPEDKRVVHALEIKILYPAPKSLT
jgi:lipopolysaccharide cholinephosphotransferase